jgi:hypothetical protein
VRGRAQQQVASRALDLFRFTPGYCASIAMASGVALGGVARASSASIAACAWLGFFVGSWACGGGPASHPGPQSQSFVATDDTFINSSNPDNNNGASPSIYSGVDGRGGVMRGLVRFALPAALQGSATVSSVQLRMTVVALGNGNAGRGVARLQAVSESWVEGNGIGSAQMMFTVGEPCGASVSGATWNQPRCAAGTATTWSSPGGAVVPTVSGQVDMTGVPVGGQVIWDSAATGNSAMSTDVQSWIDSPSGNNGWRISSADEMTLSAAQRFDAAEGGASTAPSLTIVYSSR